MIDPREEFKNIIRELAQEEVKSILQNEDIFKTVMGTVIRVRENNQYDIDIVTTILKNILNQSGVDLKVGDSVMVAEKYGSNYSNCYISAKAGKSADTINQISEKQLNNLLFSIDKDKTKLIVTLPDGIQKTISFD